LDRGQTNRRVFSTLANRVSSRSHSVFTIKVIKIRKGADAEDMGAASTSRFSIVDLAGSERVVNTQTTGERLKEAGNINKSLMVLGQCMEVLRKNQEREKGRKVRAFPSTRSAVLIEWRCSLRSYPSVTRSSRSCSNPSLSETVKLYVPSPSLLP
jgi:kinesin family protein 20